MADDPNKTHVDSWFVSTQPWEIDHFIDAMQGEFPGKRRDEISAALMACRRQLAPSEGREKLKDCVRKRLRGY